MFLPLAPFLFLSSCFGVPLEEGTCESKLEDVKIVPTYADQGTSGNLNVTYHGNNVVGCGNELSPLDTLLAPTVTYDVRGKCDTMAVIMFDPDTPLPKNKRIFLHWFVVNIPSEVMKSGYNGQAGSEKFDYFMPAAPTGNHRYTFCVYCQEYAVDPSNEEGLLGVNRVGVHPRELAAKHHLGNPEACNFFYLSLGAGLRDYLPFSAITACSRKLFNRDNSK